MRWPWDEHGIFLEGERVKNCLLHSSGGVKAPSKVRHTLKFMLNARDVRCLYLQIKNLQTCVQAQFLRSKTDKV